MPVLESTGVSLNVLADAGFMLDWRVVGRALPPPGPSRSRSQYQLRLRVSAGPSGCIDRPAEGETEVHFPVPEMPVDDARRLVTALVQRCHQWQGFLGLHATAITFRNTTLALLGPYGAGKTVTSLRLHELGAELLANDATLIEMSAEGGGPAVASGSAPILLSRESLSRYFPGWLDAFPRGCAGKVDLAPLLGARPLSGTGRRLDGFLFVSVRPDASTDSLAARSRNDSSWISTHLFRASAYHFDRVVGSCGLPLALLESAEDVRYRWRCAVALAERLPCYYAGGELERVVDEALAAIADCESRSRARRVQPDHPIIEEASASAPNTARRRTSCY